MFNIYYKNSCILCVWERVAFHVEHVLLILVFQIDGDARHITLPRLQASVFTIFLRVSFILWLIQLWASMSRHIEKLNCSLDSRIYVKLRSIEKQQNSLSIDLIDCDKANEMSVHVSGYDLLILHWWMNNNDLFTNRHFLINSYSCTNSELQFNIIWTKL